MLRPQLEALENAMIDFHNLTHLLIALYDENFSLLCAYPHALHPFCAELRKSPELTNICLACDARGLTVAKETRALHIYQCHMGLTEAISPIIEEDEVIGYLMLGQAVTKNDFDRIKEQIRNLPEHFGVNREHLFEALTQLMPTTHELLSSAARIMEMCACYLSTNHIIRSEQDSLRQKVDRYIRANLSSRTLGMREICKVFSISRSTLYAMSDREFGMGISDYIRVCRIERAKHLILKKSLPLYEISRVCGFSAPNYFSKTFRQITGVLPKDYSAEMK